MNSLSPPAYAHWPDAALLQALLADDRAAFAELYERHWYRVFALAHRRLKSRETAEELVLSCCMKWRHHRFRLYLIH